MYKLLNVALLSFLISGCSILDPWVYKINKQQGNITVQKHIDKLEIGMTKEQVRFVLGTPMAMDSFNQDRWDYIYTFKIGNDKVTRNNFTVYFADNKLIKMEGTPVVKVIKKDDDDDK